MYQVPLSSEGSFRDVFKEKYLVLGLLDSVIKFGCLWQKRFFDCVVYDFMRCRLGFLVKAMCGGKFDCKFCLVVLIYGVRRFIFLLFQMGWRRFGKVRVIIHIYFQGFLQGVDDGCANKG